MSDRKNRMEFSEKTVDRAIEAACKHFNADRDDLEIEIITKGSTGLFGIGGRPAKISALLREQPEKSPVMDEVDANSVQDKQKPDAPEPETSAEREPEVEMDDSHDKKAEDRDETATEEALSPKENRRPKADPEEIAAFCEKARHVASEILSLTGLEGNVEVKEGDKGPFLDISGEDLSIIIGKEGNTLNALEFLVNLVVKREDKTLYRVVIEAQGYREKKEQGLRILAEKTAEKVQKSGKSISMQPMSSRERRVVHMALKGKKGIKTHSSGEGRFRKVIIVPLRRRGGKHGGRQRSRKR
jgi:spoIIIJ-associated protein